jgi:hypothetical protein
MRSNLLCEEVVCCLPLASEVGQEILFDLRFSKLRFSSSLADEGKAAPCRNGLCKFVLFRKLRQGLMLNYYLELFHLQVAAYFLDLFAEYVMNLLCHLRVCYGFVISFFVIKFCLLHDDNFYLSLSLDTHSSKGAL